MGVQSMHTGLVRLLREFTALNPAFSSGQAAVLQSMRSFCDSRWDMCRRLVSALPDECMQCMKGIGRLQT